MNSETNRPNVRFVAKCPTANLEFSVVTLVASGERYDRMVESYVRNGFSSDATEFLALDNRHGNNFDGYSALRAVYPLLNGKHVIFCHDDVLLLDDGVEELRAIIRKLDETDPCWCVAGNAGGIDGGSFDERIRHLEDPSKSTRCQGLPKRVVSLDENFLLIPRDRLVFPSVDLDGFHMFGPDICLQVELAGGSAFVIPFFLRHESAGGGATEGYYLARKRFEQKYANLIRRRRYVTATATLYFGTVGRVLRVVDDFAQRARKMKARAARRANRLVAPPSGASSSMNTNSK